MTGVARISIDGEVVTKSGWQFSSPVRPARPGITSTDEIWVVAGKEIGLVDRWSLQVGNTERHTVTIEKTRPTWAAAFRPHYYKVLVDDRVALSRRGY